MSEFFHPWWNDWASFLHMGRYAVYVWGSVAITAVVLVAEQLALRLRAQRMRRAQLHIAQQGASS
ncbi:MAG: heme exporter protein CcmD [Burkholderiaceae bacterium]|jgi:heme exporter protein D|nr:heme exporter protein CcmD [Burkholderiaceae bacterium]